MVTNNRIRDVVHTSTTRMLKLFIILSIFLCLNSNVFAVNGNNYNTSLNNRYLGYETAKEIYANAWVDKGATEAQIKSITDQFNLWFENQAEDITLRNICFFFQSGTYDKKLYWFVSNGSYSSSLPFAYLTSIWESTSGTGAYIQSFESWTYDQNGAISGATTGTIPTYRASTTAVEDLTNSNFQLNMNGELSGDNLDIYITDRIQAPLSTFEIYGYNRNRGYGVYFLKNTFELVTNPAIEPTPTPTPTPTPSPTTSGDYGPAIDNINNNLNNIQSTIKSGDEEIKNEISDIKDFLSGEANFENKEITSGEIIESINIETIRNPYDNFWFELTEILNDAFTKEVRSLNLKVRNKEFQINIEQIGWNPSSTLRTFLNLASTTAICIAIIKWITIITEKIQSGSMDQVLEANEEGICNLF